LTTASSSFVAAASAAPGWCGERWPGRCVAPAITFDQLIERYGEPIFAKVDVEGFEAEALAGHSRPIEAFSFEFTTILRRVAIDCVTRCRALGAYRYNAALGETQRLAFTQWVDAEAIGRWLQALPDSANSGDIYARLRVPGNPRATSYMVSQTGPDSAAPLLGRRSQNSALGRDRFEPPSVPRVASRSLGLEPPSETGQIVCCQTQPLHPVRTLAIL
jgi:hypothetical protein